MNKLIQWIKSVNQNAKIRGKFILKAKERLACMDDHWRLVADYSHDALGTLLMGIGLAHIEAMYQGQMAAQNFIRSRQAPLN